MRRRQAAYNYAISLGNLERFEEARSLMRKSIPVARRVLGESDDTTLHMRCKYAVALYSDAGATLDDIRDAVTTLEEVERTARRVLSGSHPTTIGIGQALQRARTVLHLAMIR